MGIPETQVPEYRGQKGFGHPRILVLALTLKTSVGRSSSSWKLSLKDWNDTEVDCRSLALGVEPARWG